MGGSGDMIWRITCLLSLSLDREVEHMVDGLRYNWTIRETFALGRRLGGVNTRTGPLYFREDNPVLSALGATVEAPIAQQCPLLSLPPPDGPRFAADWTLETDDLATATAARLLPRWFTVETLTEVEL